MRDFGRSLMRHYLPEAEMPPLDSSPLPPAWQAAAETPLVWPEPDAPSVDVTDELPPDAGLPDTADAPQTRRSPRKPQQPALPPSPQQPVQRKPTPESKL